MLASIFGVISVILGVLLAWFLLIAILSICGTILKLTFRSPIFWAALIGGLLVYLCGGGSNSAIIIGMSVGGGLMLLGIICSWLGDFKIFKIIFCTLISILIGSLCEFMILFGLIGFIAGIFIFEK